MSTIIRNASGRFVSKRDVARIAAQLDAPTPRNPFAERAEHSHSTCPCWDTLEEPVVGFVERVRVLARRTWR